MGTTTIKRLENRSTHPVRLWNVENDRTTGHGRLVLPGESAPIDMWVPWARSHEEFEGHHLRLEVGNGDRYYVWQAAQPDGDFIRFSTDGQWREQGEHAFGFPRSAASLAEALGGLVFDGDAAGLGRLFVGDRTIVVLDNRFETMPIVATDPQAGRWVEALLDVAQARVPRAVLTWSRPTEPIPSVPRASATAFSVAGPPSDAYIAGRRRARFLYADSGKRYEFAINKAGRVVATHPDGRTEVLDRAVSFHKKRLGEYLADLPPFDLIAASGGRVFAKAKGQDRFFFATMDHMFVHMAPERDARTPDSWETVIPSTYFKLDPEFARDDQTVAHLLDSTRDMVAGDFAGHVASERVPVFRKVLERQLNDMMMARLARGVWHEVDSRPPQNVMGAATAGLRAAMEAAKAMRALVGPFAEPGVVMLMFTSPEFRRYILDTAAGVIDPEMPARDINPPEGVPSIEEVRYERPNEVRFGVKTIKYERVLDVGVGHVHLHQQYDGTTGGEIQPVWTERDYAFLYRLFNGPVADGDGFIDGTANFYALVRHDPADATKEPTYSLLFQDEQLFFSQRWRLAHPTDRKGLMFAAAADLWKSDDTPNERYGWRPDAYWCPFVNRHVDDRSRLAVAAQVCLVTGRDPNAPVPWGTDADTARARIYSINYSWSTLDRSWRWRELPAGALVTHYPQSAVDAADETVPADGKQRVYPQSIRLRDDMTLHLRGSRDVGGWAVPGRWYQRYLPADNALVPAAPALVDGQMPGAGYSHPWKFVAERAFRRADQFSHFGVYDTVDGRSQYYEVAPLSASDEEALRAAEGRAWVDVDDRLFVSQWKFRWDQPADPGLDPMRTPSLFNPHVLLRVVRRNGRWIATHWDKRDDDMRPFERLPARVTLACGDARATVTLTAHRRVARPPAVRRAYLWTEADGTAGVAFELAGAASEQALQDDVWRVRAAAFAPLAANPDWLGDVVPLLTVERSEFTRLDPKATIYTRRWKPAAEDLARLRAHCTPEGEARLGTSIWFENVTGQAAPPESMLWNRSPEVVASVEPASLPLGYPGELIVHAHDRRTGVAVGGRVVIGGRSTDDPEFGPLNQSFGHVFRPYYVVPPRDDSDGKGGDPSLPDEGEEMMPTLTLGVPGCVPKALPVQFHHPALVVTADAAAVPLGRPVTLTVRVQDARTLAPVEASVWIDGAPITSGFTPFTHTFTSAASKVTVNAWGYPDATVPLELYQPTLRLTVEPAPLPAGEPVKVTVRAVDARTGQTVVGRVKLGGVDAGSTGTAFTRTFWSAPPSGTVVASGYADAPIPWPALALRTMAASYSPTPLRFGGSAPIVNRITVAASDARNGALVAGDVYVAGVRVGATNTPFDYPLKLVYSGGEPMSIEATVRAPGYRDAALIFQAPELPEPMPGPPTGPKQPPGDSTPPIAQPPEAEMAL